MLFDYMHLLKKRNQLPRYVDSNNATQAAVVAISACDMNSALLMDMKWAE